MWSVLGTALILFVTYFQVEISVAINNWYGPFYDLIQTALSKSAPVTQGAFYGQLLTFAEIAFLAVTVGTLTRFFVSHYIFRWRTAMNDYYVTHWPALRTIEGASQRVQEDTMRFSSTVENLGVNFVDSILTLIAFLPVLLRLSSSVTELPWSARCRIHWSPSPFCGRCSARCSWREWVTSCRASTSSISASRRLSQGVGLWRG